MTNSAATVFAKINAKTLPQGACHIWQGTKCRFGYGMIRLDGRRQRVHRVVYTLTKGEIPDGMVIMHECDTPGCINPAHLHLGTTAENTQDMHNKGRAPDRKGAANGNAKLSDSDVLVIRARHQFYSRTNGASALAREYDVSGNVIDGIVRRLTWTHLP